MSMNKSVPSLLAALIAVVISFQTFSATPRAGSSSLGIFADHADIGAVLHPGAAEFDRTNSTYTLTGSGENMWLGIDAFQFVWKKITGDVTLTADIAFLGDGGNPHRKAVLMIRESLDADSPYIDVARHGNGLTSLQYRLEKGDITHQIVSHFWAPKRVRVEKHGDDFSMWIDADTGSLQKDGMTHLALKAPFYVGIGVCSHDKDVVERALFSHLQLETK
jgi:TolB protein